MLLAFAIDPTASATEIAGLIGVSMQTLKRWWSAYRRGGVPALIGASLGELTVAVPPSGDEGARWTRFLDQLPLSSSAVEWIETFQSALVEFFDEVDRVSIALNAMCDLMTPGLYEPAVAIIDYGRGERAPHVLVGADLNEDVVAARLQEFERRGFPLCDYHRPIVVVVTFAGRAYLGSMFFWRLRTRQPFSDDTTIRIESLSRFFEFMLSDAVARVRLADPVIGEFDEAFNAFITELKLSPAQIRVALLLVQGRSHDEIAEALDLSINTVRSHLRAIYARAGVSSAHEFIAHYSTPHFSSRPIRDSTHSRRR